MDWLPHTPVANSFAHRSSRCLAEGPGACISTSRIDAFTTRASILIAVPLLVIIAVGLLLQTKRHRTWVQRIEQRGTGRAPTISLD